MVCVGVPALAARIYTPGQMYCSITLQKTCNKLVQPGVNDGCRRNHGSNKYDMQSIYCTTICEDVIIYAVQPSTATFVQMVVKRKFDNSQL
jgi:hypothetical protein